MQSAEIARQPYFFSNHFCLANLPKPDGEISQRVYSDFSACVV
jgi:hypothetical protein